MSNHMSRLMVELAVGRAIDEISRGNMRREMRKLVDLGRHFATATFPHEFFELLQGMLSDPGHPYFTVADRAIGEVDRRFITGFEINLGFESMSLGAKQLRRCHEETGAWLPWFLGLDPDVCRPDLLTLPMQNGVMSFLICTRAPNPVLISSYCHAAPQAAFFLAVPDETVTQELIHALDDATNLCIIPVRRSGDFISAPLLKSYRRIYSPCRILDENAVRHLMDTGDLSVPGDPDAFCPTFYADSTVSDEVQKAFDDFIVHTRLHPTQALLPLNARLDVLGVEHIIARNPDAHFSIPDEYDLSAFLIPGPEGNHALETLAA